MLLKGRSHSHDSGKSRCIKWLKEMFHDVFKWEHGVQYQCLATQNTMAALIGGNTVHSWSHMPINRTDAHEKAHTKNIDGDVDALFEDCLGMRWLLLDEVSTFGVELLNLLNSYLRRACKQHPHAKTQNGDDQTIATKIYWGWNVPKHRLEAKFSSKTVFPLWKVVPRGTQTSHPFPNPVFIC